jgi:hypothetical protein
MRSSLWAAWCRCCATTWRARRRACGCSRSAACFMRDPSADGERAVAGVRQPMRVGGLAYGPAEPAQWGRRERAVDFFDVKGDVESLLAPLRPVFVADSTRRCTPAAARVSRSTAGHRPRRRTAPAWRQAYDLPQAPVLFELDLDAVLDAPVPAFSAGVAPAGGGARPGAGGGRRRGARRADGQPGADGRAWSARHAVRRLQARQAVAGLAATSAAWRCGWNCWISTTR